MYSCVDGNWYFYLVWTLWRETCVLALPGVDTLSRVPGHTDWVSRFRNVISKIAIYFVCVQNSDNKRGLNARTITRTKMADRFERSSWLGPVLRPEAAQCHRHHHTVPDRCVHRPRGGGHLLHCGLPALTPAIWLALLHAVVTRRPTAVAAFWGLTPKLSRGTLERFHGF
jgi:hypothetical protein